MSHMIRRSISILGLFSILALSGAGCRALAKPVDYPVTIDWQPYESGLARAKAEGKPVMLLFGADWCEPCHIFARKVLSDPRVIEASKGLVVVHVNVDERDDLAKKYRHGGSGLPRLYFLTPEGVLLRAARHSRPCSPYTHGSADTLLEAMATARRLASDPATRPEEDPHELTPAKVAEMCTPKSTENACVRCLAAHCCTEIKSCHRGGKWCLCSAEPGAEARAIEVCGKAHCAAECARTPNDPKEPT